MAASPAIVGAGIFYSRNAKLPLSSASRYANIKERQAMIMSNQKPLLSVKTDYIFKLIFGDQRNVDILGAFLGSVLDIPEEEYEQLIIVDPHIKKEMGDDKYGVLDVKVFTKSSGIIHVEIQRKVSTELRQRVVYGQSKMITEQMSSGDGWGIIKRAITILITEAEFVSGDEGYHHQFRYRTKDGMELTDIVEINTLDLGRLPATDDSTELWNWLKFISSSDREEMKMLTKKGPQMKKAVGILMELSEDERIRKIAESREWARRDQAALIKDARNEGLAEGVELGKSEGKAEEGKKWESVVAAKEAEIHRLNALLGSR
jgi:predicted transposase/invertase (TIGR01784 family)